MKNFLFLILLTIILSGCKYRIVNTEQQINLNSENKENKSGEIRTGNTETEETIIDDNLYKVVKIVDGDTVDVEIGGKIERLRLIGIDTPETVDPRKPVQCFGIEASNKTKELLNNKSVKLEADTTQGERDKYSRLLRYIFLEDGTNFNEFMVREGYAHEYTYDLPYKYQKEFQEAEKYARENKKGLWADGVCEFEEDDEKQPEQIAPIVAPNPESVSTPESTSQCDCSGNIYNCGDFNTHAEAQLVYLECGGVNNDVHGLDRDLDGLACETLP